jgi:hypothetical protein
VRRLEILVRPGIGRLELQRVLKAWAMRHDADVRPRGRLVRPYKTEGENMHWHLVGLRKGMGTVEVTYLPSSGRLMVLVHDNRRGLWAGEAYKDLIQEIEQRSGRTTSKSR